MTNSSPDAANARYGCLECREDAELVLSDRLHPEGVARYHVHLRACKPCRRAHQLLGAVYRAPDPASSGPGMVARDREFAAILRKARQADGAPWYQRLAAPVGVAGLSLAAVTLTVALFTPRGVVESGAPRADESLIVRLSGDAPAPASAEAGRQSGVDHSAQAEYGRVIAGRSFVAEGDRPVATDTFPVGTRFEVDAGDTLQIGLMGKLLAHFGPGSEVQWASAGPRAVELELQRGMIAIRYERLPADPVLKIRTPSALVRVVGTVFTVEVDDAGRTAIAVLRGKVEVRDLQSEDLVAEIQAGYRFDVARSTYADVGRAEVRLAMPLSDEASATGPGEVAPADGRVPESWVVPGLPAVPELRRLENIVVRAPAAAPAYRTGAERPPVARTDRSYKGRLAQPAADDGQALIDKLVRDTRASKREQLMASLAHCQRLYEHADTRYLSARCLTRFISEHGDEDIVEGHLLIGILRMDFANDYPAAKRAFEQFLARAPDHPDAELARYRLWLASTENGDIHEAFSLGREYLRRYPDGKYAGKILQRFPQLVSEL